MTEVYNPYKRVLTAEDQDNIRKLMAANPVIELLIAETMVLMPPKTSQKSLPNIKKEHSQTHFQLKNTNVKH